MHQSPGGGVPNLEVAAGAPELQHSMSASLSPTSAPGAHNSPAGASMGANPSPGGRTPPVHLMKAGKAIVSWWKQVMIEPLNPKGWKGDCAVLEAGYDQTINPERKVVEPKP